MNRRAMLIAAGGALAVGVKTATGSALPSKPVKGPDTFSLAMEGPNFEALKEIMPKGTVIEPYFVACEKGRQTLFLKPVIYGAFRDSFMGWVKATLPNGVMYICGFEVRGRSKHDIGQMFAELEGREFACKTLLEFAKAPLPGVAEMFDGDCLPKHGEIKWMRDPS